MKFSKDHSTIYIRLDAGDKILSSLYSLVKKERIHSAWISGIGACTNIEVGFYDIHKKDYIKNFFTDDYEITSLIGNFTYKDKVNPWWHVHLNFSDKLFNTYGGHLFEAEISAACEIFLNITNQKINRIYNENIGLCLMEFDD